MPIDVRRTEPHEYRDATNAKAVALLQPPISAEAFEEHLESWEISSSFSAWDDDRCVGHAAQFLVDTTVPGGARLPTGAVTRVGVIPTHRRRGAARMMMHALIDDSIERGLALMSLRASEATIYQRYGFGVAGDYASATIDPARALPLRGVIADGSIELLPGDQVMELIPDLYDRVAHRRPGRITRPRTFFERYYEGAIKGTKAAHVAVHRSPTGELDGYAAYTLSWASGEMTAGGKAELDDLFALDDATELALWQFLLSLDLVRSWSTFERPTDDLIRYASHDIRAHVTTSIDDEQWVRLIDVHRCLASRTYRPMRESVRIAVTDPTIERNNDTWEVDADGVRRSTESADITAPIDALSAVYLGGRTWTDLAALNQVTVHQAAAVTAADGLFGTDRRPICGSFF